MTTGPWPVSMQGNESENASLVTQMDRNRKKTEIMKFDWNITLTNN